MLEDLSRGVSKRLVRLLKERPEMGRDEAVAKVAGAPTVGRAKVPAAGQAEVPVEGPQF
jgi:hypothetical protein